MGYFPQILNQEGVTVTWKQREEGVRRTLYDFDGIKKYQGPHHAYAGGTSSELPPGAAGWAEISDQHYPHLYKSDDGRYFFSGMTLGEYLQMLFKFKIDVSLEDIEKIVLLFEGYADAPTDGVTIKVWNHSTSSYDHAVEGPEVAEDRNIKISLTENLANYVDADGYIYLFARNTYPNDGETWTTLACDYVSCEVKWKGTYADTETGDLEITWDTEDITAIVQPAGVDEFVVEAGYSVKDYMRIFVTAAVKQRDRIVWLGDDWEILGVNSFYFRGSLEYRTALCRRVMD